MTEFTCRRCSIAKSLDDFSLDPKAKNGHRGICKKCTSAKRKEDRHTAAATDRAAAGMKPPEVVMPPKPSDETKSLMLYQGIRADGTPFNGTLLPAKPGYIAFGEGKVEVVQPKHQFNFELTPGQKFKFADQLPAEDLKLLEDLTIIQGKLIERHNRVGALKDAKSPHQVAVRDALLNNILHLNNKFYEAMDAKRDAAAFQTESPKNILLSVAKHVTSDKKELEIPCVGDDGTLHDKHNFVDGCCTQCPMFEPLNIPPGESAKFHWDAELIRLTSDEAHLEQCDRLFANDSKETQNLKRMHEHVDKRAKIMERIVKEKLSPEEIVELLTSDPFCTYLHER